MSRLSTSVGLLLAACVLAVTACAGGRADHAQRVQEAELVVEQILAGDYDSVRERFSADYAGSLSEDQMREGWVQYERDYGSVREQGEPEVARRGIYTLVTIPLSMERGEGQVTVSFDRRGDIAGLWLQRRPWSG